MAFTKKKVMLISDSQPKKSPYEDALGSVITSSCPSAKSELEVSRTQKTQLLSSTWLEK